MTARNCLVLTGALLFATLCNLKAQEEVEIPEDQQEVTSGAAYDHKIIAILPLKTSSVRNGSTRKDSSWQEVVDKEESWSLKAQEALYNAITKNKEKLLVEVQDWHVTDSLLTLAGIDFRKVNFMDKQRIAAYLKVDALLVGQLVGVRKPGSGMMMGSISSYNNPSKQRKLSVLLYDGKTGDAVWSFDRKLSQVFIERDKWMDTQLFDAFRRKFPYTR